MKRYAIALLVLTLVLVLIGFAPMWIGSSTYQVAFTLLPIYFAVVTGLMHYGVVSSFYKAPRTFIKNFLGLNLGCLFIHLVVLFTWSFTHIPTAKPFILGFCICYAAYLVFETTALILFIRRKRREGIQ